MRQVKCTLFPDVAGSFKSVELPLDDFLLEMQYILMHRNIPPFNILNIFLERGYSPRVAEWEPFTIEPQEYGELVTKLLANPRDIFKKIDPPENIQTPENWYAWLETIGY